MLKICRHKRNSITVADCSNTLGQFEQGKREKDAAAMPANVDKAFADAGVQVTPEQKAKIAASLTTDVNSETKQIDPIVKDIAALSAQIIRLIMRTEIKSCS